MGAKCCYKLSSEIQASLRSLGKTGLYWCQTGHRNSSDQKAKQHWYLAELAPLRAKIYNSKDIFLLLLLAPYNSQLGKQF